MPAENTSGAPRPVARPPHDVAPRTEFALLSHPLLSDTRVLAGGLAAVALLGLTLLVAGAMAVGRSAAPATVAPDLAAAVATPVVDASAPATGGVPGTGAPTSSAPTAALEATAGAASREATITEGRQLAADIADIRSEQVEFGGIMASLAGKAKQSQAAVAQWNSQAAARQSDWSTRVAAIKARNAAEKRRYLAGRVERANSVGQLVIVYTYKPRYLTVPVQPAPPAPLTISIADEARRMAALQQRVNGTAGAITTQAATAKAFSAVYPIANTTVQMLKSMTARAVSASQVAIVSAGAKGNVIDAAKFRGLTPTPLALALGKLTQSFDQALTSAGLTQNDLAAGGSVAP